MRRNHQLLRCSYLKSFGVYDSSTDGETTPGICIADEENDKGAVETADLMKTSQFLDALSDYEPRECPDGCEDS